MFSYSRPGFHSKGLLGHLLPQEAFDTVSAAPLWTAGDPILSTDDIVGEWDNGHSDALEKAK